MVSNDIPIGNLMQYHLDIYPKVNFYDNYLMNTIELHEYRKICLIRLIEKRYGGVIKKFAEATGIEPNYISRILSSPDAKEHRNIGNKTLTKISKKHPDWLEQENVEDHENNVLLSRSVNISGEIQGGDNGYLSVQQYPEGYATGCVMHPTTNKRCYALRVVGDSMHPRIKHGEIIVVDPDRAPEPGDDVVISLKDGRRMVKVYLYKKQGEITLGSINDGHGNITIKFDQIYDMHYVAARLPTGAVCNKA